MRYTNREHTFVALNDGRIVPVAADNPDWQAILASGAVVDPYLVPLSDAQSARISEAWALMLARVNAATVSVTTGAGTHQYGLDQVTQDNLQKALLAVLSGLSPNPRPWTPKGASAPIAITYDEVKAIAGAVWLAYDGYMQAYLAHKRGIMAADTADAVVAYDLTQGWPA